jgi:hypothetical protein
VSAGIENLLFSGRWASRRATCTVSAAGVLARGLASLRALGFARPEVRDDAGTVLEQAVWTPWEEGRFGRTPEALPPEWTGQPAALTLRAGLVRGGARAVATLRYTPRFPPEQAPLCGSLRTLWDVAPEPGAEEAFRASLDAALADEAALRELWRRTTARGAVLAEELCAALASAFDVRGTWVGRTVVLAGYAAAPQRFADLLAGIPDERRAHLAPLEARFARSPARWPALDAEGVPGWVRRGGFESDAEVLHVA